MPRPERPLDSGDSQLLRFAADLRRLRSKAGSPTYRELARSSHYSATVLSDAASGRRLPSLAVALAYADACDADVDAWRARWHEVAAELAGQADGAAEGAELAPYVGLAAFQPTDTERFFGRERLTDDVSAMMGERRFLGVFGASGSGKSSLLRAGLVARADAAGRPTLLFSPGQHPLTECAIAFAALAGGSAAELRAEFAAEPDNLHLRVRQFLVGGSADADLLVVVDQFEEIFTVCADEEERFRFVGALLGAATAATSRTRVVLGIRSDFYGHCGRFPELVVALRETQLQVGPMTPDELRQAIVGPSTRAGCTIESALVSRLIADATGEPAVLPLISHALLETWRRRRGSRLTLAGYEETGGIHNAIADSAEALYAGLSTAQQEVARQTFLRLVALGDGTEETKRRIGRASLDVENPDTAVVLEKLARARLVTLDRDTVEISHEALIRCWPRLRDWLNEDRAGLRIHQQLTDATEGWNSLRRDPGSLYRGVRLTVAQDWAATNSAALTGAERAFLDASRSAQAQERATTRRRTRRLRQLLLLLSLLLAATTAATVVAARAEVAASEQRDIAVARQAVTEAAALRDTNPALSVQLGLAAYRLDPIPEARDGLLGSFALPYAGRLTGHTDAVFAARFSPNGHTLATASADRTVRLWDVANSFRPELLATLTGHTDAVMSAVFSPDGRTLATASTDRTVRLWDVADPRHPRLLTVLIGHTDAVWSAAFSPDGRTLATASTDRTVRLWDITDPRHPKPSKVLSGHTDTVRSVAFSPDGNVLATGSRDRTVRLWDARTGAQLATITGHTDTVVSVVFSPDGHTLATASWDRTAALWDVADPRHPVVRSILVGHTGEVWSAAFSPDGRTVVTASSDKTTRLWDVLSGRQLTTITGHTNVVYSATFGPDGNTLATASDDKTVRLVSIPKFTLAGHTGAVSSAAYRPDGRVVATAGSDATVRLWDTSSGVELATLTGHTGAVNSAVFNQDGRIIATVGDDETIRLWDVTDPRRPRSLATLTVDTDAVFAAAFSPDGRLLATAGNDATTHIWDVTDPGQPQLLAALHSASYVTTSVRFSPDSHTLAMAANDHTTRLWNVTDPRRPRQVSVLTGQADSTTEVAFSPDGRALATADWDHTIWLWNISDLRRPEHLSTLADHTETVTSVAFSPDGRQLATGSGDNSVRLWNVVDPRSPAESAVLTGHTGTVTSVAFSPDGHVLITSGIDATVRVWDTDIAQVSDRICAIAYPRITPAQWQRYLPGLAYRPPCA